MRIILLGPPGSGKGTQGEMLSRRYRFPRVSTGDLLRKAVQERTAVGKKAEALMHQGLLVTDEVVTELVRERIAAEDCGAGYLLDGYPRTVAQAEMLEHLDPARPETVLEIRLSAEAVRQRLGARLVCAECQAVYNVSIQPPFKEDVCEECGGRLVPRVDDRADVVAERLRQYSAVTEPLVAFYENKKVLQAVDGAGSVEEVFSRITALLDREVARHGIAVGETPR